MKNLFDPAVASDVKKRINHLRPDSERRWGQISVTQMLLHCNAGLQMATGVINPKRASFPGNVIGSLIKPMVFGNDKPMRRNSPSVPELFPQISAESGFEQEQKRLCEAVETFALRAAKCCSLHPHPFFGPLNSHQWAILMYKHLDHHLAQFDV